MSKLPVIVGMGGMNAAGRTSNFHSYKRMICDVLPPSELASTWRDLAHRMQLSDHDSLPDALIERIKEGTLVRRIEHFDPSHVLCNHKAAVDSTASFVIKKSKLSKHLEAQFTVEALDNQEVRLTPREPMEVLISDYTALAVSSAGSIPRGFDLDTLYNAHHHPRGLKLTVYGISDALHSLGMEWEQILGCIQPDEVAVYAGSALSQVDHDSLAGLIAKPLLGARINSKMMPLSLAEMPADFVNSYVINSVGATGHNVGACATFLYNLKLGLQDIQSNRAKVVFVGCAEAPIVPEIIEGFRVMGALATDEQLCAIDQASVVDNRRATRPFSTNVGFTLAESVQFVVLMDDALALHLGLPILGSVADVFVHADGNKKSIAGPGVGNYITVAKTMALARAILGQDGLAQTYVQAHGTGTPQNRTTESHILNEVAKTFGVAHWPVTGIKSYVGHSVSVAAGDQLATALGVWAYGYIPGIKTIDHVAADVHQSHLNVLMEHHFVGERGIGMKAAVLNSKGFGGNNATALVLSPTQTMTMLQNKHGEAALAAYHERHVAVKQSIEARDAEVCMGREHIRYQFGECVMDEGSIHLTPTSIRLSEFDKAIEFPRVNPFVGYC